MSEMDLFQERFRWLVFCFVIAITRCERRWTILIVVYDRHKSLVKTENRHSQGVQVPPQGNGKNFSRQFFIEMRQKWGEFGKVHPLQMR